MALHKFYFSVKCRGGIFAALTCTLLTRELAMTKSKDAKKEELKKPTKTLKEKRLAKQEKKKKKS
jgi:hypothetical protein